MFGPAVYYDCGVVHCDHTRRPREGWPRHGRFCYLVRGSWYELTYKFGQLIDFARADVRDRPTWGVVRDRLEESREKIMKRRDAAVGAGAGRAATDEQLQGRCPLLHDYLTATTWEEDGSPRQTSTLLLFAQDGQWKAFLRDREAGEFLAVSGTGFGEVIDVLEASLSDGLGGWRKDRNVTQPPTGNKPPRKG